MAEVLPAPFAMHGARDAIAAGLEHIEEQVTGIEQAVVDNPGLAFDLAKTLVESVCLEQTLSGLHTAIQGRLSGHSLVDEASTGIPTRIPTKWRDSGDEDMMAAQSRPIPLQALCQANSGEVRA